MQGASGHGRLNSTSTGQPRRARSMAAAMAGVTAIMLFATACGGSGGDDGGSAAPSASKSAAGDKKSTLAYAKCMRENGVADFPDPNAQGLLDIDGSVDMKSTQAQAADKKCKELLPAVNASPPAGVQEASLAYSKCMRANGVPKFPDPNAEGGLDIDGATLGVDPQGPVFKAADKTCQPILEKVAGGPKAFQSGGAGPAPR
ncbi:hypothetical protein ACFVFI_28420 [Streptomyces sp. NPDC057705]|uniref:hypothetical protein n=1 Tax=Streptomyces sp. NPDC057705 TaxID=3346222 RepID=UPI0036D145DD